MFFFALVSCVLGVIVIVVWPSIVKKLIQADFVLSDGSISYASCMTNPSLSYLKVYVFNWTNSDDVYNKSVKPHFEELGPYVFQEYKNRTNWIWHSNGTVSFIQARCWKFLSGLSKGRTLNDTIISLNPAEAPVPLKRASINKKRARVTTTIRNLLFNEDHLILGQPTGEFTFSRFSGNFTMSTGSTNLSTLGNIYFLNGLDRTEAYAEGCDIVQGSLGELWPPMTKQSIHKFLFSPELCRSILLSYSGHIGEEQTDTTKWTFDEATMASAKIYNETRCYCPDSDYNRCPPNGLVDISKCWRGIPFYVSYPHFFMADAYLVESLSGIHPNRSIHRSLMYIDLQTGLLLQSYIRLQFNLRLRPSQDFELSKGIARDVFIPVFWYSQETKADDRIVRKARESIQRTKWGLYIALGLFAIATVLVVCIVSRLLSCLN